MRRYSLTVRSASIKRANGSSDRTATRQLSLGRGRLRKLSTESTVLLGLRWVPSAWMSVTSRQPLFLLGSQQQPNYHGLVIVFPAPHRMVVFNVA